MDVARINNTGSQPPPPPPPVAGSGEFAPVPAQALMPAAMTAPPPAVLETRGGERAELPDMLQRAVNDINATIFTHRRHMDIRMHEATNRRIVTVYDSDTNEAVREIPPERVLDAHANLLELAGLFVDARG